MIGDTWSKPFGFIGHPKMASQSVRKALLSTGGHSIGGHHGLDKGEVTRIRSANGIVACVVRNPWDVMVSWWSYNSMKPYNPTYPDHPPFAEWLPRILLEGNGWIEKGLYYGAGYCNRIIRFEHPIERQLNGCLTDCGLPTVELPHLGESPRDTITYQPFYTTDLAIQVYCRFADEIDQWGYTFEDL